MIHSIRKIDTFGPYMAWRSGATFQRVNLIYGANGSGKTSLADLLQAAARGDAPVGCGLEVDAGAFNASPTVTTLADRGFWDRVLVFNKKYIEESLSFDSSSEVRASALLVLGKANIDRDLELKKSEKRRQKIDEQLKEISGESTDLQRQTDKLLKQTSERVVTEIGTADQRYRATNVYSSARVRQRIESTSGLVDPFPGKSIDVTKDLSIIHSPRKVPLAVPTPIGDYVGQLHGTTIRLLTSSVVTQAIDELLSNATAGPWVQTGLAIHEHLTDCLFCGSPISTQRRAALKAHFDDSLRALQSELSAHIEQLTALSQRCGHAVSALPHAAELYDGLWVEYEKARQQASADAERLHEAVEIQIAALRAKLANPFSTPSVDELAPVSAPDPSLVAQLVARHNQRSTEHSQTVSAAAQRVELATLDEIYTDYSRMRDDLAAKTAKIDQLKNERRALSTHILELKQEEVDPVPLAGSLTEALARLLGKNSLKFELSLDGTHYMITRDGNPALGLSEGERTAIALLYFLAALRSKTAPSDPIVIVDDPVSSLDQGVLFGVSAHLWSELAAPAHVAQVFILTHSFELFRQWVNQLDSAKGYLPAGGQTIFELRSRHETRGGLTRVVPSFEEWPTDRNMRKRLRSQYHFLFAQVAQVVIESGQGSSLARQLDILSSAPNSARKMLEGFLAFRQPALIGDFTNSLRKALTGLQETNPVRVRVTRYLHAYSHYEEGDHSKPLEPGEATAVMASVFELIKLLDEPHFDAMSHSEQRLLTVRS